MGLPLWLEGPQNPADFNGWSVNIYGSIIFYFKNKSKLIF
jgi:hypothetical protein